MFSSLRSRFPGGEAFFGVLTSAASLTFTDWKGHIQFGYCCFMEFHSQEKQTGAKSNLYQRQDQYRWKRTRCIWKHNYNTERSQPATSQSLPFSPWKTVCIMVKLLFSPPPLQPHALKPLTCSTCNHSIFFFSNKNLTRFFAAANYEGESNFNNHTA